MDCRDQTCRISWKNDAQAETKCAACRGLTLMKKGQMWGGLGTRGEEATGMEMAGSTSLGRRGVLGRTGS